MKDIIFKAENISKQYRLGQVGTGTLSHDLNHSYSPDSNQDWEYQGYEKEALFLKKNRGMYKAT